MATFVGRRGLGSGGDARSETPRCSTTCCQFISAICGKTLVALGISC